jgi:hypothetical protein
MWTLRHYENYNYEDQGVSSIRRLYDVRGLVRGIELGVGYIHSEVVIHQTGTRSPCIILLIAGQIALRQLRQRQRR